MAPRRFDHLAVELSVAAGELAPRYALWVRLSELGWDPMDLRPEQVLDFLDRHLAAFLAAEGLTLSPAARRRLRRRLRRFDPEVETPEEVFARLFGENGGAAR